MHENKFWLVAKMLFLIAALALTACENAPTGQSNSYQVTTGKLIYQHNCLICHGIEARGVVKEWYKLRGDGKYPAPPLNGSAQTWLHDRKALLRTIDEGGIPRGGTMPPFKEWLTEAEKTAVLAYIRSLWPKSLAEAWEKNNS